MTVATYIDRLALDAFKIVAFIDWQVMTLYDSRKTSADVPRVLLDSIVETINNNGKVTEIEIYPEVY